MSQATWDKFFMDMAKLASSKSKDRSRKVGCVIVGPDNEVRSIGFNGFPRGIDDSIEKRHQRPLKYKWVAHAELNAVANAARAGIRTDGCAIYIPWLACSECAKAIIQAGIRRIVCVDAYPDDPIWKDDMQLALEMLIEAGVKVRYYCEEA